LDIDNFKVVNDSLGHAVGDRLLIDFAKRLVDNLRQMDAVSRYDRIARFGGDEFAILLDDITDEQDALRVASRLNEILGEPFSIDDKEIFITTSIGITINTMGYDTPDDMLRDADIAMYRAKELGKSRVEIYDTVMHNSLMARLSLETELRKAMQKQDFRLHYQPILNLQTLRIVGMEALLRWYSPRGVLEPPEFFAAMDTSGLINYIDLWALDYACHDAAKIQDKFSLDPPLFVSVNISANFVHNPDTIEILDNVLKKSKINTDSLRLEITERVGLKNEEPTLALLKNIQERGIHLCLDDFGTGYSTLSYLLQFPIAGLKIDQSFIQMMTSGPDGYRIIETLKSLASPLGMSLIAEGIETEEQLNLLQKMGIGYGQGYLFSKALDIDNVIKYIQHNLEQPIQPPASSGIAGQLSSDI
ncbi:MAG: bifunctional diguanylate cyclase/phosphodiesterase, partial [Anaerolineales bacterium]